AGQPVPSYGHVLDINNTLTPPGQTVAVTNFLTFTTLPGVSFTLTELNIGTGGGCPPASGTTCTPADPALISPSDPLGKTGTIFEDTAAGAVAEFSVNADAIGTAGEVTPYTGVFSGTFTGMTTAQVLADLASGGSVTVPFAAKFTPSPASTVPEPSTASFAILGLLLLVAGAGVRRFSHS
ncbi:MAG TPA: PEP-CTERM sorting domain-containing protein, partial [Terriglobia bacterium]|nr:PEP-CTERM sorting domain-containing protein [Terriglobia bacterium]